jgi:polyhydroxyalkanoate synthesis repressor PhaR
MTEHAPGQAPPAVTIKKYANRRLYNTATSAYVTLDDLAEMVKQGTDFVVTDAKTGEDLTRSVLTQIIVEQEGKGQNLLPVKFLRQIIGFYGDSLGGVLPRYLEMSMESFAQNESNMRRIMQDAFKGLFPTQRIEEIGKQNLALFESAMKMFNPFGTMTRPASPAAPPAGKPEAPADFQSLKSELETLQAKLHRLSRDR